MTASQGITLPRPGHHQYLQPPDLDVVLSFEGALFGV